MVQISEVVPLDRRLDTGCRKEVLTADGQYAVGNAQLVVIAVGIVVPYVYAVVDKVFYIGVARQEPQQFMDYAAQEYLFGRQQREPLAEVETHLVTEDLLVPYPYGRP